MSSQPRYFETDADIRTRTLILAPIMHLSIPFDDLEKIKTDEELLAKINELWPKEITKEALPALKHVLKNRVRIS